MSEIRSGVIVTDGPDAAATEKLKPRAKATFAFQFVEGGPIFFGRDGRIVQFELFVKNLA